MSQSHTAAMPASLPRFGPFRLVGMHLLPGIPTALLYTFFAGLLVPRGYPAVLALMLAIPLGEVPACWTLMVRHVRRETGGRFTLRDAFPWWSKVPAWVYLSIGLPVTLLSVALMGVAGTAVGEPIREAIFPWVPEWFVMRFDPGMFASLSQGTLITMWALGLVALTLAGGLTQELYFRGFLLPRLAHLGSRAPVINAALFAVFHLNAPWGWIVFFPGALLWGYLVYWRRSTKIGLFCHVGMLLIQWLLMTLVIFGVAAVPEAGG